MALPNSIDPAAPAGSAARSLGDDQIRAFKQFIIDIFGLPTNAAISSALFTVDTSGSVSSVNLVLSTIKIDKVDARDLAHTQSDWWLKGATPHLRLVGTETGAKDWRVIEVNGTFQVQENTATEGSPTWATRLIIGSTSGNLILYSGTGNKVEIDHAATADRVVTLPDGTDTLVGRDTTDTLTNKTDRKSVV